MKRNLVALAGMLALAPACGEGRGDGLEGGAAASGVEDTTAAPSADLGTPSRDTAADTGGAPGSAGDTSGP
jgi:hypothetical protein